MSTVIFGTTGLLGNALMMTSPKKDVVGLCSKDVNLIDKKDCFDKLSSISKGHREVWINSAARVGGVKANTDYVGDFYTENTNIGGNVISTAWLLGVKKLVSILSTCIYPDANHVKYPLTEDQLHNGPPHHSNFGYAYAKRMLDVQSRAYRQQFGCNFITVIPNNLYGPHDNYDLNSGHVIPSLIRKFFEAHLRGTDVEIWGTGKPLREFTFSADAANIIWWCTQNYDESDPVNIGNTEEYSIAEVANEIGKIIGFKKQIRFNSSKPEGQYRKPTSNNKLKNAGCDFKYTSLQTGLELSIDFFVKKYPNIRGVS